MTFLLRLRPLRSSLLFFFNDTATTEIYTLSLHDALPILWNVIRHPARPVSEVIWVYGIGMLALNALIAVLSLYLQDRKSTRLNSSHSQISYAVFCLKKKKKRQILCCNALNTDKTQARSAAV